MPFHKSCYTSRSSGYKYRTLSTNTGEKKRIPRPTIEPPQVNPIEQKFNAIHDKISTLINNELGETNRSRNVIFEKFEKINAKINSMIELQDNVVGMRQTLNAAGGALGELYEKIQKIEVMSELNSIKFRKSPIRTISKVIEEDTEQEIFCSDIVEQPSVVVV